MAMSRPRTASNASMPRRRRSARFRDTRRAKPSRNRVHSVAKKMNGARQYGDMRLGKLATFAVVAVGLWLGSGASAHAQTACQVDLEHVPADVSEAITSWVSAEPRCAVALSVRVVPTDGGLYVVATDANGGVRERVVPDAETAAVLVASWAADDAGAEPRTDIVEALSVIGPPEPTRVRLRPVRSRLTPAAYTGGDEVDGGPGNAPGRRRGAGLDRMVTVGFTTAK